VQELALVREQGLVQGLVQELALVREPGRHNRRILIRLKLQLPIPLRIFFSFPSPF
jgi:hypothetical protein